MVQQHTKIDVRAYSRSLVIKGIFFYFYFKIIKHIIYYFITEMKAYAVVRKPEPSTKIISHTFKL